MNFNLINRLIGIWRRSPLPPGRLCCGSDIPVATSGCHSAPGRDRNVAPTPTGHGRRFVAARTLRRQDGFSLIAAAGAAGVLSLMVVGYLAWVTNEFRLSKRSHEWAEALNLAEAGVELALGELNNTHRLDPANGFTSNRGWLPDGGVNDRRRAASLTDEDGRLVGGFEVRVQGVNTRLPVITSVGTVTPRGGATAPIVRGLRVVTERRTAFKYAFVARRFIQLGNAHNATATVDSYDSTSPLYSNNGMYDPSRNRPYGNIAVVSGAADAITFRNTYQAGQAATGPGGRATFNNSSSVGASFIAAERSITEADARTKGWLTDDFSMLIEDVALPPDLATAPNLGAVTGGITLGTGDYRASSLTTQSGDLVINGDVRLYVTGNVSLAGNRAVDITPGSRLEVFLAGNLSITGRGVVNQGGRAVDSNWWGLPSSTSWNLSGNGDFTGTVYAPSAALTPGGNTDFMGAFVGDNIVLGGSARMHYDESLGKGYRVLGYAPVSWLPLVLRDGVWVIETN